MNINEYEHVKKYFKGFDTQPYLFCAILKSVRFKLEGWSAKEANRWATTHELLGYVGEGTQNNREYEQAKKELATHSRKILKNIKADPDFLRQTLF